MEDFTTSLSDDLLEKILPVDIREKGKDMSGVYYYLYCVENCLRSFVEVVSKGVLGGDYFNLLDIKKSIKKSVKVRKEDEEKNLWLSIRGISPLFYLDFNELGTIIQNNWGIFKKYFPSQDFIIPKISELAKCRNLIAHNSYLEPTQIGLIRSYFETILKQIESVF